MIKIASNNEIKAGDWVQIVNLDDHDYKGCKFNGEIGHVYQVDKISPDGFYHATKETSFPGECLKKENLRKVTGPFEFRTPASANVLYLIAKENIYREDLPCRGDAPPIIPKGTKVWHKLTGTHLFETEELLNVFLKGSIHPFDNYWGANIPGKYFEIDNTIYQPALGYLHTITSSNIITPKFNVGDKVRGIGQSDGWGNVKRGDIGVVKVVNSPSIYTVNFPNQSDWTGNEKCFELVTEENPISKFKVGDKVIINRHPTNKTGYSEGWGVKHGVITEIDSNLTQPYTVANTVISRDTDNYLGLFSEVELTLDVGTSKPDQVIAQMYVPHSMAEQAVSKHTSTEIKQTELVLKKKKTNKKLDTYVASTKITLPKLK